MQPNENQMNTGNTQQGASDMTADEHAAALGFITTLGQHVMSAQNASDPSQQPETAPGQEQPTEPQKDLQPEIDDLKTQFEGLKTEVEKTIKDEVGQIKDMIKTALTENE